MTASKAIAIVTLLDEVDDPRERRGTYSLVEVLFMAICGAIGGCNTWVDIALFGKTHLKWFRKFLPYENGVPSHDTFNRLFRLLDTGSFLGFLLSWLESIQSECEGRRTIAIDGKTLRGSFDRASGKSALHLVSAWASKERLVLGQEATGDSNEITAIPRLLELLEIKGAIVTIDATGCQKEIAEKIRDHGGDYILALKANQPTALAEAEKLLAAVAENNYHGDHVRRMEKKERCHGRTETREYVIVQIPREAEWRKEWKGLRSVGMVLRRGHKSDGTETGELRYYLTSLPTNARQFADAVRRHWSIENQLHWTLDVTFTEDASRLRKDAVAETTALLRRLAVSILQQDTSTKCSLRCKRLAAGWDPDTICTILAQNPAN